MKMSERGIFLFPEARRLNEFSRPRIRPKTPEFGSKRTPPLRSTVPTVQRHMAYFAHSSTPNARSLSHSPSAPPPSFPQSPYPPRSLVSDERTHPHRPRLVVYHSTCRPLSSSRLAVVTPLNNPGGPEGDTVTVAEKLLNTEY